MSTLATTALKHASSSSNNIVLDSSGNVGIGTSSPDALLTVNTVASFGAGSVSTPSIAAQGDLNTGIYFPGADRIGFAEGGVQVGEFDASSNFKFNSGYGSVATAYGCRAWVNFNGTGVVAIRASGNVTSITDNGTGDYTVNFTTAMPDANYSSVAGCAKNDGNNDGNHTAQVGGYSGALQTSSACRIRTVYITGFTSQDSPQVTFAAFR